MKALLAIVLFGIVSLLGDVIYEGVRGSLPSFFKALGADAVVIGLVFGGSDLVSYLLRVVSGLVIDLTGAHWLMYIAGYAAIGAIPLLALAPAWQHAAALVVLERVGKGVRAPARDVLISVVGKSLGRGRAFGIHEVLDQIGAVAGPAIVAAALYLSQGDYRLTYLLMLAPYVALMAAVAQVYARLGSAVRIQRIRGAKRVPRPSRALLAYSLAVCVSSAGLIHVLLILYILSEYCSPPMVVLAYLAAQAIDAISALAFGHLYDRLGLAAMAPYFAVAAAASILAVAGGPLGALAAVAAFGVAAGMQESCFRAAVADLSPAEARGTAYGLFNTAYGLGLLASGAAYGLIIDNGLVHAGIALALVAQAAGAALLYAALRLNPFPHSPFYRNPNCLSKNVPYGFTIYNVYLR